MICEFYTNFIDANCNSIANQLGAMGITVLFFVGMITLIITLINKVIIQNSEDEE